MVNTQSKSINSSTIEEPPIRIPPKRNFSETQGGGIKPITPDQIKENRDTARGTQRRRTNPPPQKLDARAMIKLVPTLSEKDLKHLVSTIGKRRKREEGVKSRRPSEPTTLRKGLKPEPARRTQTVISPAWEPPSTEPPSLLMPIPVKPTAPPPSADVITRTETEERLERRVVQLEQADLAGALLRQASRWQFTSQTF